MVLPGFLAFWSQQLLVRNPVARRGLAVLNFVWQSMPHGTARRNRTPPGRSHFHGAGRHLSTDAVTLSCKVCSDAAVDAGTGSWSGSSGALFRGPTSAGWTPCGGDNAAPTSVGGTGRTLRPYCRHRARQQHARARRLVPAALRARRPRPGGGRRLQAWLDGVRVIGITAGTSTPEAVIGQVEGRLQEFAKGRVAA